MIINYISIFTISLIALSLELFITQILNLKTWNHVVYSIIPFSILGYGIGANACLLLKTTLVKWQKKDIAALCLAIISITSFLCSLTLIYLPIQLAYLINILKSLTAISMLLISYAILMIPFIPIGFLTVFLFFSNPNKNHRLYFVNLLGSGLGALLFYALINKFEIIHSIILLASTSMLLSLIFFIKHKKKRILICTLFIFFISIITLVIPEPKSYVIDKAKGWEYIPGFLNKNEYEHSFSKWSPLGRVDIFCIKNESARKKILKKGPFQINLDPLPEFS